MMEDQRERESCDDEVPERERAVMMEYQRERERERAVMMEYQREREL